MRHRSSWNAPDSDPMVLVICDCLGLTSEMNSSSSLPLITELDHQYDCGQVKLECRLPAATNQKLVLNFVCKGMHQGVNKRGAQ